MAEKLKDGKAAPKQLQSWLDAVATYEKVFSDWQDRAKKLIERYRDEKRDHELSSATRFNILWSNTQTLRNATFARLPKPDVSRRFRDNDPVGRVASLILERALDYEVQHYPDYKAALSGCVLDRFLSGRGTAWVRYEPKFRAAEVGQPEGGLQPTEDVEAEVTEVLDYECAPCDYVDWRDFGHSVARTWEEVNRVWRKVYMTKEALEKRFGEDLAKRVPMDAVPYRDSDERKIKEDEDRACVYEGWDKEKKLAVWFSKGVKEFLDERDDPLKLEEFFPCPKPMYATLTNDSLIPIPDFCLYQDQSDELDLLSTRINGLIEMLQIRGVYDASQPAIERLFTEGENGVLKPVKNWAAFAEKQGLKGAIDIIEILPIANALISAYQAFDQIKNQIYEITRISDIMRGFVDPDEKLGQSQLKTQYSNLGIKAYQEQVAVFATQLLQLKAQVMCNKFDAKTLIQLSAADQLSKSDIAVLPQALELLLGPRARNPEEEGQASTLRSFRIEVAADSLIQMDEEAEKASRMEFLQAQAMFLKEFVTPVLGAPPQIQAILSPLMMETWKYGTTAFRVGKNIEGAFDEASEKLKQLSLQPQQSPVPPEVQKQLQQAQEQIQKKGQELQAQEADLFKRETQQQVEKIKLDADRKVFASEVKLQEERLNLAAQSKELDIERKTDKEVQAREKTAQETEKLKGQEKVNSASEAKIIENQEGMKAIVDGVVQYTKELQDDVLELQKGVLALGAAIQKPRRIVRGKDGKAVGTEVVG